MLEIFAIHSNNQNKNREVVNSKHYDFSPYNTLWHLLVQLLITDSYPVSLKLVNYRYLEFVDNKKAGPTMILLKPLSLIFI